MPQNGSFLAFDTSTDVMSVAVTDGLRVWQHTGPGGAKASTTLIPVILALLADAGLALGDLQAIAFGRGPGSFTGLRTACAVAQGLAYGANKGAGGGANTGAGGGAKPGAGLPVLPIDTLLAVAEEARLQKPSPYITALLDARMDEMYVQRYACSQGEYGVLTPLGACELIRPEELPVEAEAVNTVNTGNTDNTFNTVYAGNVFSVYEGRLPAALNTLACLHALPTASAMLRLAPRLAAAGHCVPADQAMPMYVRNKVAQTTAEREAAKALKLLDVAPAAP